MQHHGRNFVTAAFGRHRSMRDRGERGTVPNKLHGESRAWVHDSAAPSPGPVSGSERSATQSTLPACQASAGPATSGQGRQPRSGGAGRDRLYRMAPVWPHGDKQVTTLGHSQPQPPFPAKTPFDATSIAHDAGDMLADAAGRRRRWETYMRRHESRGLS